MGASFNGGCLTNMDRQSAIDSVYDAISSERDQYGRGAYSSSLGQKSNVVCLSDLFATEEAACDFISEKSGKWDNDVYLVRFIDVSGDKEIAKMEKKIAELSSKLKDFKDKISFGWGFSKKGIIPESVIRTKEQKTEFKSCGHCRSKISVKFLKNHHCPVCNDDQFALNNSDKKKIASIKEKISKLDDDIKEIKQLIESRREELLKVEKMNSSKEKWNWSYGAWTSS